MLNTKILLFAAILAVTFNTISGGALCRAAENQSGEDKESSEVKQFFKNAGCTLEKGAKKAAEGVKSFGETVKDGAKKFGGNVKDKFNEIKDKFQGDDTTTLAPTMALDVRIAPLAPFSDTANKCPEGFRIDDKGECHSILA